MGAVAYGKGIIYAALFDDGLVKIGLTRNLEKRLNTLATQGPSELLHFVTTEFESQLYQHERTIHDLFKEKRVRGEYFNFDYIDWIRLFTYWGSLEYAEDSGLLNVLSLYYGKG